MNQMLSKSVELILAGFSQFNLALYLPLFHPDIIALIFAKRSAETMQGFAMKNDGLQIAESISLGKVPSDGGAVKTQSSCN
jgi:hypothetical protein